ncbi:MAG: hypothetical protein CMF45_08900 [Legionellales bacterium]|nr:hypothetical protein [Legionellales bacterium]
MCLAIYKPKGEEVAKDRLRNAFNRNPHGAGFTFAEGEGKVHIRKGFFTFDQFWKAYSKANKPNRSFLIHFRWATKGKKTKGNCHPFRLTKTHAMIHNGTIDRVLLKDGGSDSANFAKRILAPIVKSHPNFIYTTHGQKIVNLAIGASKVAVMNSAGNAVIFNEHKGHWDSGVWYSNDTYLPRPCSRQAKSAVQSLLQRPTENEKIADILGQRTYKDYHASNRGKGRSYIDDLEDSYDRKQDTQMESEEELQQQLMEEAHAQGELDFDPTIGELLDSGELDGFQVVDGDEPNG